MGQSRYTQRVLPLDQGLRRDMAAPFAATAAVFFRELGGDATPFPGIDRQAPRYHTSRVPNVDNAGTGHDPANTADALEIAVTTGKSHMAKLSQKTQTCPI